MQKIALCCTLQSAPLRVIFMPREVEEDIAGSQFWKKETVIYSLRIICDISAFLFFSFSLNLLVISSSYFRVDNNFSFLHFTFTFIYQLTSRFANLNIYS